VTVPETVDAARWEQTYEVYVKDKYDLGIKAFFNKENPWSYQSMTARMLESIRKDYWKADEETKKKLSVEYAVNVVEKGIACCDHTCNNPYLNQMVVAVISMPGVMSPEMVEKFKIAVEQAMKKTLEQQVEDRKALQKELVEAFTKQRPPLEEQKTTQAKPDEVMDPKQIEGYKMEDMTPKEDTTELTSSGVQWYASLFVLLIMGLFIVGIRNRLR
jgi:cobaltochelatase CobN